MPEEIPHIPDAIPSKRKYTKRKAASTPAARTIDPGILALRAEHATKVAEYRKTDSSKRILRTILEKRLAQLTTQDREKLFDALKLNTAPALMVIQSGGQVAPAKI